MPMDERTARTLALLLHDDPLARVWEVTREQDGSYRVRFTDRRDGRDHVVTETEHFVAWVDSVMAGETLRPLVGICEVCGNHHDARSFDGELRETCNDCLVEMLADGVWD